MIEFVGFSQPLVCVIAYTALVGARITLPVLDATAAPGVEYTAAEAKKHIGEKATVVGKVDCIESGRRHTDVMIGGCDLKKTSLWIVVPNEVSGPDLDLGRLRGVLIAVTGKIESSEQTPQITIKSTTQIVPQTRPNPNYHASAMEKQSRGDLDGAIADLDRAIELTHERSMVHATHRHATEEGRPRRRDRRL